MPYHIDETKKIGLGLIGFGVFFTFLGVVLFFDKGLLALGNIFWLLGVAVLLGWQSTFKLFTARENYKWVLAYSEDIPISDSLSWMGAAVSYSGCLMEWEYFGFCTRELFNSDFHAIPIFLSSVMEAGNYDASNLPDPNLQEADKKRSLVWKEFLRLKGTETKDGKDRALCSHWF